MIDAYAGSTPRHQTGQWRWILDNLRFACGQEVVVVLQHRMARDSVYGRVASTSYIAGLPEAEKAKLGARTDEILREAVLDGADQVTLPYVSRLRLLTRR